MPPPKAAREFVALLEYLKTNRGFDFTGYKPASLERRVKKRMQGVRVRSYNNYIDFLEVHPEEFTHLFNTILINVTSFFRDPPAWDFLRREVIPRIVEEKKPNQPIRVWSAGAASGEEAFSLAIELAEAMGYESFRNRVKIYATDVDEEALAAARHASCTDRDLKEVPSPLVGKYFEPAGNRYVFRGDLRRSVIFGRHDLLQDASISRIDLLVCRNTLMYFNAENQAKILARFHYALNDTGYLFLGKAEMQLTQSTFFSPVNLKWRIFSKVSRGNVRERLLAIAAAGQNLGNNVGRHGRLRDVSLDLGVVPQVVVDRTGVVVLANEKARSLFNLAASDVGRLLQDLPLSYRPVELRAHIEQVYKTRTSVVLKDVEFPNPPDESYHLDIQISPALEADGNPLGVIVTFIDVTKAHRLQAELQRSNQELETAHEELQSTNEELQTTNEELQTTNEELQSTVEELETTNEELQSTVEELETMNEELQSTNEELRTSNEELHRLTDELNQANGFLQSILASLPSAVVGVDLDMRVILWNQQAEELWGLRAGEVRGRPFVTLDIGVPVEKLLTTMRAVVEGRTPSQEVVMAATNRRGKPIECTVTCTPLRGKAGDTDGIILLMEDRHPLGQAVKAMGATSGGASPAGGEDRP